MKYKMGIELSAAIEDIGAQLQHICDEWWPHKKKIVIEFLCLRPLVSVRGFFLLLNRLPYTPKRPDLPYNLFISVRRGERFVHFAEF